MLLALYAFESALVLKCLRFLPPECLLRISLCASWLRNLASQAARKEIKRLTSTRLVLSRWMAHESVPLKELHSIHRALLHQERVGGRYRTSCGVCTLDISPLGRFMNYSLQHRFVGTYTIAGIRDSDAEQPEFYVLLDRWYTDCRDEHGTSVPAAAMPWVDENHHCHSVCGSVLDGKYMENEPHAQQKEGWDISENPVVPSAFRRELTWAELQEEEKKNKASPVLMELMRWE